MGEIWKDIPGFPGYKISSYGRVESYIDNHGEIGEVGHLLKPLLRKGYYYVDLYDRKHERYKRSIHRLVGEAFLKKKSQSDVINHINGNKLDNRSVNLEWIPQSLNSSLAAKDGLYRTRKIRIVELDETFNSIRECAHFLHCHPSDINHAINSCGSNSIGYTFEYADEKPRQPFLRDYQKEAIKRLKNGMILCGTV